MKHRRGLCTAFVCLVALALSPSILAYEEQGEQKPAPEELLFRDISVVTASKKLQKRSDAPAAISVITAAEIDRSGARTIAEAIQFVAGVNVVGLQGSDIRGVGSGARILLLIDGRRSNDVFAGGFEDGLEYPLTAVERIEVIKGPASSLYGTNAFAGIINVITKTGAEHPGLEARVAAGNLDTRRYEALWGSNRHGVSSFLSLARHTDEGNDLFGTNDYTRASQIFGKADWKGFTLSGGYRPNEKGVPNIGGLLTPTSYTKRNSTFGHLQYHTEYGSKWTAFSQLYFQRSAILLSDPNGNLDLRDLRIEGEARTNYRFGDRDNLTAGFELRRDRTIDTQPSTTDTFRSTNRSFYVENEYRPVPRLRITTGVRADDNSVFGSSVNPRVGVVASLPRRTVVKAFYGTAFRGPDFVFLFTDLQIGSFRIVRNPDLKPERITSREIEVTQPIGERLEARLNVYRNSMRDLITVVFAGANLTYANLGQAASNGVEIGLQGQVSQDLTFFTNLSLQDAKDQTSRIRLPLVPRRTFNAGFTFHPGETFTLGMFGKYVGPRPTSDVSGRPISLPRYFKGDVTLSARLTSALELTAGVYNLFDARYGRNVTTPQNGTQALVGLRYRAW